MDLAERSCTPANERVPAGELPALAAAVPGWTVEDEQRLLRSWRFADFVEALAFVNAVASIAEAQAHHPDVRLSWGHVQLTFTTHDRGGLTEADFIMAARVDALGAPPTA
jgi:4a-hydroxytetrahydrobiopterin dehydratase